MGTTKTTAIDTLLERCRYDGSPTHWNDIVGHEAAKRELSVIAEQYRRSSVAERLGITLVKGLILMSTPGAGKSMLARALASTITRAIYVIPSAEASATVIREVYAHLRDTPCVIVWDEADVILRDRLRDNALQGGRTVVALCAALDGIDALHGPITLCLTAEGEYGLDEARPGHGLRHRRARRDAPHGRPVPRRPEVSRDHHQASPARLGRPGCRAGQGPPPGSAGKLPVEPARRPARAGP